MMQSLWKYVDDLVGKGLDIGTIGLFLWYASASLLTLAMPIAILISSIMTFGNLGESFELVAIKSSGISLLRFMRPLIFFAAMLCGITFLFANYVIPVANLKFKTLYYDITYKKPALDLKPGGFYKHIPGYVIKIGKKDNDGKTLHQVLIYDQSNPLQDNTIIADTGFMSISPDKKFLEFRLLNGYRYQEKGASYDSTSEYIRMGFKEYKKLFDVSSLQMMNTNDSVFKNEIKMMSVSQLDRAIDTLHKVHDSITRAIRKEVDIQLHYNRLPDSVWKKANVAGKKVHDFNQLLPDSTKTQVYDNALGIVYSLKNAYQYAGGDLTARDKDILFSQVEWHRKFSLSMACMVLFFIGAPLGSIIRKGGLGMPLVVAVLLFLVFHLLNMFGEKFVKEGITTPFSGMWLAVLVLSPLGAFFTYKAMHDSQLFNKEFYFRAYKRIVTFSKALVNRKKVTD